MALTLSSKTRSTGSAVLAGGIAMRNSRIRHANLAN